MATNFRSGDRTTDQFPVQFRWEPIHSYFTIQLGNTDGQEAGQDVDWKIISRGAIAKWTVTIYEVILSLVEKELTKFRFSWEYPLNIIQKLVER